MKKDTIWNPLFTSIMIANICQQLGQQMMQTLIPKYAATLGAPAALVGIVSSMFALSALAIRPISAPAADSMDKKKLLMGMQVLLIAAFIFYSFADTIQLVIAARLIHGVAIGVCTPLFLAMASLSLPDDKLGSGIGIFSLATAMSQALGPTVGLNLAKTFGYSNTFRLGAAMTLVALFCVSRLESSNEVRPPFKISLSRIVAKSAILPTVLLFFLQMSYSCISSFLAIYGGARGVDQIGLYFTAYAATLFITRPICGKLVDKYGFDKVIVPGLCFFAVAFSLISRASTLTDFLIAGVVGAFGFGVCQPTIQGLAMKLAPKSERGAASNTCYIGMDCGMLTGPVIAGNLIDKMTASGISSVDAYSKMYMCMIIPMAMAMVYFLCFRKKIQQQAAEAAAANAK